MSDVYGIDYKEYLSEFEDLIPSVEQAKRERISEPTIPEW